MSGIFACYAKKACRRGVAAYRHMIYHLLGRCKDTITVRTKQGVLTIPTRDVGIGAPLYSQRQYEYDSSLLAVRFLRKKGLLPSADIEMVDIGANIGVIGIGLLLAGDVARVLAVEPVPKNFRLLRQNAEQNAVSDRMLCLQFAAGETNSTLSMELSLDNPGDHRIRTSPVPSATERLSESTRQTIQVPSLSLPQILALPEVQARSLSSPDLVWIDVQGYEGYIFRGAAGLLKKPIPTVSEIWPYGILRAGMELEEFSRIVQSIWANYWIERRQRLIRYPTTMFMHYLDELGNDGYFENVIFTK